MNITNFNFVNSQCDQYFSRDDILIKNNKVENSITMYFIMLFIKIIGFVNISDNFN